MSARKYVSRLEDIPQTECWVIVKSQSVHIPGDERSRTNPGHGYPASTEHYVVVYEVFTDEEAFKADLARSLKDRFSGPDVRGFKMIPYVTKTVIEVSQAKP